MYLKNLSKFYKKFRMKVLKKKTKKEKVLRKKTPKKKSFKAELEALADKDPEFYDFLKNEEKDIFESDDEMEAQEDMDDTASVKSNFLKFYSKN